MQKQSPSAAAISDALQALEPGNAEARVRWLVNFSQQELATLSDEDLMSEQVRMTFIGFEKPWDQRMAFMPEPPRADKKQRRVLRTIQRRVRSCFDALVRNEPLYVDVPRTGHWTIQRMTPQGACGELACPYLTPCPVHQRADDTVPKRRARLRAVKTAEAGATAAAHFVGDWWLQLVLLSVRLLDDAGAWRLMSCPFQKSQDTTPCGKLFIARRRQRFCSTEHSRAAAFQRWLVAHGGTRAKFPDAPQRKAGGRAK